LHLAPRHDGRRRYRHVRQRQPRELSLHQFQREFRGADFHETRDARDDIRRPGARFDAQDPRGVAKRARVGDRSGVQGRRAQRERDRNERGRNDQLQVGTNVIVQAPEASREILVIVEREIARMRFERKRAQRSRQPGQLHVQLLRVHATRGRVVPQDRDGRLNRVQQPEVGDFARGEVRRRRPPVRGDRVAARIEHVDDAVDQ
jgi:hypothetical protein